MEDYNILRTHISSIALFSVIFSLSLFGFDSVYAENTGDKETQNDDNLNDIYFETNLIYKIEKIIYLDDDLKINKKQAKNYKPRFSVLYLNGGIGTEIISLNPPVEKKIISKIKNHKLQTIQRIDKENDIWMSMDKSEPVLKYQQNEFGTFNPIQYRIFESIPDEITMNMGRLNSNFNDIIQYEINRATIQFDSQLFKSELGPSWNYKYPLETDRIEKIKDIIKSEKIRALETYQKIYTDNEKSKK